MISDVLILLWDIRHCISSLVYEVFGSRCCTNIYAWFSIFWKQNLLGFKFDNTVFFLRRLLLFNFHRSQLFTCLLVLKIYSIHWIKKILWTYSLYLNLGSWRLLLTHINHLVFALFWSASWGWFVIFISILGETFWW